MGWSQKSMSCTRCGGRRAWLEPFREVWFCVRCTPPADMTTKTIIDIPRDGEVTLEMPIGGKQP